MLTKKECVAMLLAGGQGSRLYALTNQVAKPAVEFGAKNRIIDFPLSNCTNSGIDTVGVLTQYQPLVLNEYIGNGQPWDLDRVYGGVHILPPYQGKKKSNWYKGTANAIYQNLAFIERYEPDYVLILSGDHIYKMDYDAMLRAHEQKNADCTIAVLTVPMEDASRFGIMSMDGDDRITEFAEKPKQPKSNQASMGIYIFSFDVLKQYLTDDENNPESSNDFGKDIIPKMLADGKKMYGYHFEGYWKDVGTIKSLWEANMDLLGEKPKFDIFDTKQKIYARKVGDPPQFVGDNADIQNSIIGSGAEIDGTVINSVISGGVKIQKGAIVRDSVIFSNVVIKENAIVEMSIIDEYAEIGRRAVVGARGGENDITVIARNEKIADKTVIPAGEMYDTISGGAK
ncbi:MAG TPA: glucose-1-phosphate adenylyltransferase [Firmicutes bacterium]|nr:glucose-1-phosphate adenylyltransferase [Bacillota bacterium]